MTYPDSPGFVDTDTSRAAANAIAPHISTLAAVVYAVIYRRPSTCFEIEMDADLSHQTASARVRELALKGFIEDSGWRRPTASGRNAIVWRRKVNAT